MLSEAKDLVVPARSTGPSVCFPHLSLPLVIPKKPKRQRRRCRNLLFAAPCLRPLALQPPPPAPCAEQTQTACLNSRSPSSRKSSASSKAASRCPKNSAFLLFDDKREVELVWNGKTNEVTNVVLPSASVSRELKKAAFRRPSLTTIHWLLVTRDRLAFFYLRLRSRSDADLRSVLQRA